MREREGRTERGEGGVLTPGLQVSRVTSCDMWVIYLSLMRR